MPYLHILSKANLMMATREWECLYWVLLIDGLSSKSLLLWYGTFYEYSNSRSCHRKYFLYLGTLFKASGHGHASNFLSIHKVWYFALWKKYYSYALIPMALDTCWCVDLIDCSLQAGRHTIILMQPSQNRASRTFMDYNSINHALDGTYGLTCCWKVQIVVCFIYITMVVFMWSYSCMKLVFWFASAASY